jgi:glycosyltransferase involved in cell wall biosynthesis
MRILVVCQYYYPENFVVTPICESLAARGHTLFVLTGQPNYGFPGIVPGYEHVKDEVIHGVKVHRVKLHPRGEDSRLSLIRNYLSFWKHAKHYLTHLKDNYDVVYCLSMSPLMGVEGGCLYGKKHHVPVVIHCLDLWPESAVIAGKVHRHSLAYRFLYHWSHKIYASADEILISSPSFARYFKDVLKLGNKKLVLVPQPPLVDNDHRDHVHYTHAFNLVYAGNVGNLQLIENYVHACALLKGKYDFQFHIIGGGSRLEAVKELINSYELDDVVMCQEAMPISNVVAYYEEATALLVPLAMTPSPVSQTIPNKLVSSLYYGRPILASIGGDGRQLLAEAGGSLFAPEDPKGIASVMETLFHLSVEERNAMGAKNRAYFDAHYAFNKVMDQLEAQLREIKKS